MKKHIKHIVLIIISLFLNSYSKATGPERAKNLDIDVIQAETGVRSGKKLTGPLMAVLDVAVKFRPEILDSMQKATGRADATFKMFGGEEITVNMTPEEIHGYIEKTQIKGTFDGEFKGMGLPLASYFYTKKKRVNNISNYIYECLNKSAIDKKALQNSLLIKFFESKQQKAALKAVQPVSLKEFQANFLMFLKQEIQTTEQLKSFVTEVKQFFRHALTLEEKKAYISGILMFVAQFFDEMKKNSHKVVLIIRESLFDDPKTDANDDKAYMLKYFKAVSDGRNDQTLLAYLDQEIKEADQLTAVCAEIKTFFADVYASMTPVAIDVFHKYQAEKAKEAERNRILQTVPTPTKK